MFVLLVWYARHTSRPPVGSARALQPFRQAVRKCLCYVQHMHDFPFNSRFISQAPLARPFAAAFGAKPPHTPSPEKWTHDRYNSDSVLPESQSSDVVRRPFINLYAESFDKLYSDVDANK